MAVKQKTRNIALTPYLDRFVRAKINSGRYQSASEVVRESLRIMEQHEKDRQEARAGFEKALQTGYEQVRRGRTVDPDEVLAEIKSMSRAARVAAKKPR